MVIIGIRTLWIPSHLRAVSNYFQTARLTFTSMDYAEILSTVTKGTFLSIWIPLWSCLDTANFTGYTRREAFDRTEQDPSARMLWRTKSTGIKFMMSNSATEFIREQYASYDINVVHAKRAINSNASKRGLVDEVVIRNMSNGEGSKNDHAWENCFKNITFYHILKPTVILLFLHLR